MEWFFALPKLYQGGAVLALAAIWYAWQNRAALMAMVPKGLPSIATASDPDVEDVAALKRLQARADRNKCPKAKAAIAEFGRHFFECGEHSEST